MRSVRQINLISSSFISQLLNTKVKHGGLNLFSLQRRAKNDFRKETDELARAAGEPLRGTV